LVPWLVTPVWDDQHHLRLVTLDLLHHSGNVCEWWIAPQQSVQFWIP
jgi:hypothetical protein